MLTRIAHHLDTSTRPFDHNLLVEYVCYTDTIRHIIEGSELDRIAHNWHHDTHETDPRPEVAAWSAAGDVRPVWFGKALEGSDGAPWNA